MAYKISKNEGSKKIKEKIAENIEINPLASPSAGTPALKYGDVNTETTSPGEVKGLINSKINLFTNQIL